MIGDNDHRYVPHNYKYDMQCAMRVTEGTTRTAGNICDDNYYINNASSATCKPDDGDDAPRTSSRTRMLMDTPTDSSPQRVQSFAYDRFPSMYPSRCLPPASDDTHLLFPWHVSDDGHTFLIRKHVGGYVALCASIDEILLLECFQTPQ